MWKNLIACCISMLFVSIASAGELEELKLKKDNLELSKQNLNLQVQLIQKQVPEQMAKIEGDLKKVNEDIAALESKGDTKKSNKN